MSIDPAALTPYREALGAGFILELIDTFLNSTPEIIAALYTSISTNDSGLFIRSAHTLKSNSVIFGAQLLSSLSLELETAGKTVGIELATLLPKVDQLKAEYEQVCREL
ncbi:MAG TPA: Hpt domain-containing protein, partial [Phototrophicaceae bacterium]|nr:Hpt domain-containing protein [Phototrophicaceae bacterium]